MAQVEDQGAGRLRNILILLVLIFGVLAIALIAIFQGPAIMTAFLRPAATPTRVATATVELTPTATATTAPTATSVVRRETAIIIATTPMPTATAHATATLTPTLAATSTPTPTVSAKPPAPYGSIAFHKSEGKLESLAIFNLGSNTITPLVDVGEVGDLMFNTHAPIGVWSPDNSKFAFISTFKREGPNAIKVIDFRTNTIKALYWTQENGMLFSPAWSQDGRQIAFTQMIQLRENQTGWSIHIVNADGSFCDGKSICTLRTHNQGEQYHGGLAWSRTGLLAVGMNSTGGNEVQSLFLNGWGPFNLTNHPADDSMPAFSPDGKQIAFTSTRDGHYQIYVMDSLGGNVRRVSRGDATDFAPTWSPDGNWLAYTSVRDGAPNIYLMDLNGDNVTRLTFTGGARPAWSR